MRIMWAFRFAKYTQPKDINHGIMPKKKKKKKKKSTKKLKKKKKKKSQQPVKSLN